MKDTTKEAIKEMIDTLGDIHKELEEHYSDDEWDLCDHYKDALYKITELEEHDWDENTLAHYIDGMLRTLRLIERLE